MRIARAAVDSWHARGVDIVYIHRENRAGFKAGALENGLRQASGDLIADIDADFVPQPEFLAAHRSLPLG